MSQDEFKDELYHFVCQDTDLLVISDKVENSVREVCDCLHLDEEKRQMIETSENGHSKKVYSAFLAWSDQEKERAVWGELMKCLKTLNDPNLSDSVREYLVTSPPGQQRGTIDISYYVT